MTIKLEEAVLAWVEGRETPQACTLKDPVLRVFDVNGWLYSENGQPLPTLFPAPKFAGTISHQAAMDYQLIAVYDPNAGYTRRNEDGLRQ